MITIQDVFNFIITGEEEEVKKHWYIKELEWQYIHPVFGNILQCAVLFCSEAFLKELLNLLKLDNDRLTTLLEANASLDLKACEIAGYFELPTVVKLLDRCSPKSVSQIFRRQRSFSNRGGKFATLVSMNSVASASSAALPIANKIPSLQNLPQAIEPQPNTPQTARTPNLSRGGSTKQPHEHSRGNRSARHPRPEDLASLATHTSMLNLTGSPVPTSNGNSVISPIISRESSLENITYWIAGVISPRSTSRDDLSEVKKDNPLLNNLNTIKATINLILNKVNSNKKLLEKTKGLIKAILEDNANIEDKIKYLNDLICFFQRLYKNEHNILTLSRDKIIREIEAFFIEITSDESRSLTTKIYLLYVVINNLEIVDDTYHQLETAAKKSMSGLRKDALERSLYYIQNWYYIYRETLGYILIDDLEKCMDDITRLDDLIAEIEAQLNNEQDEQIKLFLCHLHLLAERGYGKIMPSLYHACITDEDVDSKENKAYEKYRNDFIDIAKGISHYDDVTLLSRYSFDDFIVFIKNEYKLYLEILELGKALKISIQEIEHFDIAFIRKLQDIWHDAHDKATSLQSSHEITLDFYANCIKFLFSDPRVEDYRSNPDNNIPTQTKEFTIS